MRLGQDITTVEALALLRGRGPQRLADAA